MNDVTQPGGSDIATPETGMKPKISAKKKAENMVLEDNFYLPNDIVGGSIPHIPATEEEAVWNAAAQACGTDRIHYTYTVYEGRCWYLATPSSSLASNPDSWCPLAAALPGNSEFWDKETVYIYDQEGTAAALRWDEETGRMQVFSGPSRTILPRIQSMDGNFVTIKPEGIAPVPWRNRALMQEKLSRATVRGLFWSGLCVTAIALSFWLVSHIAASVIKPDVRKAQLETETATRDLMLKAGSALTSDSQRHLYRVQKLLVSLQDIGGTLTKYEIDNGAVTWEALIPSAVAGSVITEYGAEPVRREKDGRQRIRGKK